MASRPFSLNIRPRPDTSCIDDDEDMVDLCTPILHVDRIWLAARAMHRFPRLRERIALLPLFPCVDNQLEHCCPLLANVPPHLLSSEELELRRPGHFQPACDLVEYDRSVPSFLRDKGQLFFGDLVDRLKVDMALLDYNYTRLVTFTRMLANEQAHVFELPLDLISSMNEREYPLALEFFLQFDVNVFYMKTCAFRFARPRMILEGLFCIQEPEARYELSACGNCALCYPRYNREHHRLNASVVDFSQAYVHTFVNGFRTILNCSASCHTRNVVYVLTCPCGQVDYVGATMYSLHDRLKKHREHGNRIMHESLLGQDNIRRTQSRPKTNEILRKDRMKLYQHSVRCPVAVQLFLDAHPRYWRFVPMTIDESERECERIIEQSVFSDALEWNQRSNDECLLYMESVPKPSHSSGLVFSRRQSMLQMQYFHNKRDLDLPSADIDLYEASIATVLPDTCSEAFRYTIESLFISHAQTKLNTIGNVLNREHDDGYQPLNNPWLNRGDEWCRDLVRRPQAKTIVLPTAACDDQHE